MSDLEIGIYFGIMMGFCVGNIFQKQIQKYKQK
jgi:hypothetical protein